MTKKESKTKRMGDIIQAALDEFLEKGYEGASMDSIAMRAGISKGGLYHHFKSKDEILLYTNQKLDEPVKDIRTKAAGKTSAVEGLTWYLKHYLEFWQKHQREIVFYSLSMTKMLDSPPLWQMYKRYMEGYIAFAQDLFQRGIDSGEFIPHSAYDSAVAFVAALDGIIFYLVVDKKFKLDRVVSIFKEKFINSLRVRKNDKKNLGG